MEGGAHPSERARELGRVRRLLIGGGIAAPTLYAIAAIVLGLLQPGYDPLTQIVSELGEAGAPNAIAMNLAFLGVGLLLLAFAFGAYPVSRRGTGSKVVAALIAIGAVGFVGAALVPCSPGCRIDTSIGHYVAISPGIGLLLAPVASWAVLRNDRPSRGYATYSLLAGLVAILLLVASFSGITSQWQGLAQRLQVAAAFPWFIITAVRLLRGPRRPNA